MNESECERRPALGLDRRESVAHSLPAYPGDMLSGMDDQILRAFAKAIILQQVEINTLVASLAAIGMPLTGDTVAANRRIQMNLAQQMLDSIRSGRIDDIAQAIQELFPNP